MIKSTHSLEYYRQKEAEIFPRIPGMLELLKDYPTSTEDMSSQYPDAAFALMTASQILSGSKEQNAINQEAYFEILAEKSIPEIRIKHQKAMKQYMSDHRWDD